MKRILLALRLIPALILLQTLYFKFSGAGESVYIFNQLHAEPIGRWFTGISELIAIILLLVPQTQILGASVACLIMLGAIASHILVLGINVQNDGGLLFVLAIVVLVCSSLVILLQRDQISKTPLIRNLIK